METEYNTFQNNAPKWLRKLTKKIDGKITEKCFYCNLKYYCDYSGVMCPPVIRLLNIEGALCDAYYYADDAMMWLKKLRKRCSK